MLSVQWESDSESDSCRIISFFNDFFMVKGVIFIFLKNFFLLELCSN